MGVLIVVLGSLVTYCATVCLASAGHSWQWVFALAERLLSILPDWLGGGIVGFGRAALVTTAAMVVLSVPLWLFHWLSLTVCLVTGRIIRRREAQPARAIEFLGALIVLSPLLAFLATVPLPDRVSWPVDGPASLVPSLELECGGVNSDQEPVPPAPKPQAPAAD